MLRRVYLDSVILIAAFGSETGDRHDAAWEEINADDVEFLYSSIVELETLPSASANKSQRELEYLVGYFQSAKRVDCTPDVQKEAIRRASVRPVLAAADALHVACAIAGSADELVTAEKPNKPLPQASGVFVRTIWVDPPTVEPVSI